VQLRSTVLKCIQEIAVAGVLWLLEKVSAVDHPTFEKNDYLCHSPGRPGEDLLILSLPRRGDLLFAGRGLHPSELCFSSRWALLSESGSYIG
jgi:hypothetical protein